MFNYKLKKKFIVIALGIMTAINIKLVSYTEVDNIKEIKETTLNHNNVGEFCAKNLYIDDEKIRSINEYLSKHYIGAYDDELLEDKDNLEENNINSRSIEPSISYKEINLICTFYGMGEDENGPGNGTLNCINGLLAPGTIATSPNIPVHTKMYIPGIENFSGNDNFEYTVLDRGNPKYIKQIDENTHRIDIFVERLDGENWRDYKQRISDLGVQKTVGYILEENHK